LTARVPASWEPQHIRLLLAIRRHHHWSQAELAAQLGISSRTIREWESGRLDPRVVYMVALHQLAADISAPLYPNPA